MLSLLVDAGEEERGGEDPEEEKEGEIGVELMGE